MYVLKIAMIIVSGLEDILSSTYLSLIETSGAYSIMSFTCDLQVNFWNHFKTSISLEAQHKIIMIII